MQICPHEMYERCLKSLQLMSCEQFSVTNAQFLVVDCDFLAATVVVFSECGPMTDDFWKIEFESWQCQRHRRVKVLH